MTKTPLIAFRCRPAALRAALDADAAKSGQSVTEIVLRALCKKYRIKVERLRKSFYRKE